MIKLLFAYSGILILLSSCVGKSVETDTGKSSLPTVHQAIEYAMPGGIRTRGDNNREFFSFYHPPGGNPGQDARSAKKRAYAHIRILGDRRPYTIVVEYVIEKREHDGSYKVHEKSKFYAEQILDKIKDYLVSRPSSRDVIDDFKAF